ncbi:hypothetical protein HK103_007156 [Boothiomyces macroporosus]|uniref:Uncharacterized protein n=1 Tax=Boothiomyces macroporosus TaxID=261099 RepID=A0AAD5UFP0_9FUNG|nr:hypothetical protein HK103_007156 [Boothiomyces macroporosus]
MLGLLSLASFAAAADPLSSLPSGPGYIIPRCYGPNGAFAHELWAVRDMSQVCVGSVGDCGIVSKSTMVPVPQPPGALSAMYTVNGIVGLGSPITFQTWSVVITDSFSAPHVDVYGHATDNEGSYTLKWDIHELISDVQVQRIAGDWSCVVMHYIPDTPTATQN